MKKYSILVLFFILNIGCFAQKSVGVAYSYNRTKLKNNTDETSLKIKDDKTFFKSNLHVNLFLPFNDKTGFESGVSFNSCKKYYEISVAPNVPGGITGDFRNNTYVNLKYVSVPFKFAIISKSDNSYAAFSFGPQISYLFSASSLYDEEFVPLISTDSKYVTYEEKYIDYNDNSVIYGYSFKDKFKPFVIEFAATFSVNFDKGLFLSYSYERSLGDIENHTKTDNIGRILNRFTDYSDAYEGNRATTILVRSYFEIGYMYKF